MAVSLTSRATLIASCPLAAASETTPSMFRSEGDRQSGIGPFLERVVDRLDGSIAHVARNIDRVLPFGGGIRDHAFDVRAGTVQRGRAFECKKLGHLLCELLEVVAQRFKIGLDFAAGIGQPLAAVASGFPGGVRAGHAIAPLRAEHSPRAQLNARGKFLPGRQVAPDPCCSSAPFRLPGDLLEHDPEKWEPDHAQTKS